MITKWGPASYRYTVIGIERVKNYANGNTHAELLLNLEAAVARRLAEES